MKQRSEFENEADARWQAAYWEAAAPTHSVLMAAVVGVSAYLYWVSISFLVLNAIAGIFVYFCWRQRNNKWGLFWALAAILAVGLNFGINEPPPGKFLRSEEDMLYFAQFLSTQLASFFLATALFGLKNRADNA